MRLKADIWVNGLIRRVQGAGAMAVVVHRGDRDAGTVIVRVNKLNGCSDLYIPYTSIEGERLWRPALALDSPDAQVEEVVVREMSRDSDLWVIEIEDRNGRHFLEEDVAAI